MAGLSLALQAECKLVAEDKLGDAPDQLTADTTTPLDIIYGHGAALSAEHHYRAHRIGFTLHPSRTQARVIDLAAAAAVANKGTMDEVARRDRAGKVMPT